MFRTSTWAGPLFPVCLFVCDGRAEGAARRGIDRAAVQRAGSVDAPRKHAQAPPRGFPPVDPFPLWRWIRLASGPRPRRHSAAWAGRQTADSLLEGSLATCIGKEAKRGDTPSSRAVQLAVVSVGRGNHPEQDEDFGGRPPSQRRDAPFLKKRVRTRAYVSSPDRGRRRNPAGRTGPSSGAVRTSSARPPLLEWAPLELPEAACRQRGSN